jgi:hypothetical protein
VKKLFLVLLTAAAVGLVPAMADQDTYLKPGTVSAQVGIGAYWGYFGGVNLEGGADLGLVQVPFAPKIPIDFGVAGRVGFGTWLGLSAGAFGTAHYSWKALGTGLDWLNRIESYIGLGVDFLPGIGIDGFGGNSYHFDKNFAVFVESGYYATVIGGAFRF